METNAQKVRTVKTSSGFTLVELLVVMVVIGILVGITMPLIGKANRAAKEVQARKEMEGLITAIDSYYSEYSMWPQSNGVPNLSYDEENIAELIKILLGIEASYTETYDKINPRNPKDVGFIDLPKDSITATGSTDPDFVYRDPWGNAYRVHIDTDNDNELSGVGPDNITIENLDVVVWSVGVDGKEGDAKDNYDNIKSWTTGKE